ncbi:MAG: glycosyl hydrolase family 28-related protein [Myxococcota bacterium]
MRLPVPIAVLVLLVACSGDGDDRHAAPADADADAAPTADAPDPSADAADDAEPDIPLPDHGPETGDGGLADTAADEIPAPDAPVDTADGDAGPQDADAGEIAPWRSALYPEDWAPGFATEEGHALQDFSWAGYRNGEGPLAQDVPEATFDVLEGFGADPTGTSDATDALQAAVDAAEEAGGGVVLVPAGLYRVDGTLRVEGSRVVLRGEGPEDSRLWFTRHEGLSYQAHVMFSGAPEVTAEAALSSDAGAFDTVLEVEDASSFAPGDDADVGQVITEAFQAEHGMVDTWQAFDGTWQPFFRREVIAVDTSTTPHRITVDVPLRYAMKTAHGASVRRVTGLLREVGVESLGLANAVGWQEAWAQDQVSVLEMRHVEDAWIRDVASFPSPGAPEEGDGAGAHLQSNGLLVRASKRVTVADSTLALAQNRGGGGNGYLFQVRTSSEILFRDLIAEAGRHNFIQNWGFGLTGCVWLRVVSRDGATVQSPDFPWTTTGLSEFHHSLATANLIDSAVLEDGWGAVNRRDWSSGAGHTATENVFWNTTGPGALHSRQYGDGYVVGTGPDLLVLTSLDAAEAAGTAPEDYTEGLGAAAALEPQSLYEDQLARRLVR